MSWVCTNCSTSNEDDILSCVVCGAERPTEIEHIESEEVEELKVVFSDFEAFKESIKSFFKKLSNIGKKKKTRVKKAKTKKSKSEELKPTKEKKSKKARKKLFGSAFAAPWPEHKVKFDTAVIKNKGFVRSERESLNGVKGYRFFREDETSQFIRIEMAVIQKMAKKV